ncbi:thiamine pyrophosphate-binding protein [Jatrophihabitans sp. DSM 45814]
MIEKFHGGPIFGMGGFQLLPFYDAARRLGLQHHLIDDERTGAFAADAYAKVSGRVGLVDATLGPGATNLITGLVEALNAGSPIVAIVGDANREHAWKNMTQEARQVEILRPACKELIRIEAVSRIPELIRRAFTVATTGRPGPVVVDVPEDIAHEVYDFPVADFYGIEAFEAVPAIRCRPDATAIARAAGLLAQASHPIILAGGGVHIAGAAQALTDFAETYSIPVAHTLTGKGAIACTNPLSVGLFGRYDRIANDLIEQADVILVIGGKLGEVATKRYAIPAAGKTVIHLEVMVDEIGRTRHVEVPLWGDALLGIADLHAALAPEASAMRERFAGYRAQIAEKLAAWRVEVDDRINSTEVPINIARLLTEINRALPSDGYLVADGGFAAHWGGLLFDTSVSGRHFVPDRGFASIGYGVPGAIGVAMAAPGKAVVSLTGDGGFNMVIGALETARRIGLTFTVIVVNNAASGYVKALQHLMYGPDKYHASDLMELNYAEIARSFGCQGIRVESPDDIAGALKQALASEGPTVLDVVVTRDPAHMLPGVDSRIVRIESGDRIA